MLIDKNNINGVLQGSWDTEQNESFPETNVESEDYYYELIGKNLFWANINLSDDKKFLETLVDEWIVQADGLKLEESQKKLNKELLNGIAKDTRDHRNNYSGHLIEFLKNNKNNKDLKAVLDLKRGESGITLLHAFVGYEVVFDLLEAGANPDIQDNRSRVPLHEAVMNNHTHNSVYDLLGKGADPNIQDSKGKTPLHYHIAHCDQDYDEIVDLFIAKGANFNIEDNNKRTPKQIAIEEKFIMEGFWTEDQRKLEEEFNNIMYNMNKEKFENLKRFLNKHKNNEDLRIVLKTSRMIQHQDQDVKDVVNLTLDRFLTEDQLGLIQELRSFTVNTQGHFREDNWDFCGEGNYDYCLNREGFENLKLFLDKHKNSEDLKVVLEELSGCINIVQVSEVRDLFLEARGILGEEKSREFIDDSDEKSSNKFSLNTSLHYQLLDKFLYEVSQAESMIKLQEVVNDAINSGVRLNLAKVTGITEQDFHENYTYFTDYVIDKIHKLKLEENPKVASDIVCTLVSRGATLGNRRSLAVFEKLKSEYDGHKANVIKAHGVYINRTQRFVQIAKDAVTSGELFDAKVDNTTFKLEYSKDSRIDVAKITDGAKNLGLTQGSIECGKNIVKIGKSEVEIKIQNGKRNYTDLADNSDIVLTFYTSAGALEVRLYHDTKNKDLIRVKVSNQETLWRLKNRKEEISSNCLLGGLSVNEAMKQGFFTRSGKLQSSEVIKESPAEEKNNTKWQDSVTQGRAKQTEQKNISL